MAVWRRAAHRCKRDKGDAEDDTADREDAPIRLLGVVMQNLRRAPACSYTVMMKDP